MHRRCNIAVYYGIDEDLRDNEDFNLLFNIVNSDRCVCLQALAERSSADIAVPSDVFKKSKNNIQRRQLDAFARDWHAAETDDERKELIERQKRVVKERSKVRSYLYSQRPSVVELVSVACGCMQGLL